MLNHIAAEKRVLAEQRKKLAQEAALIKKLKLELHNAHDRTKAFKVKAKKRKKVLRIAHTAYMNLQRAMAHLQALIAAHAKTVRLHGEHATSKGTTKKMLHGILNTVHKLEKKAILRVQQAAAEKARHAATQEAHKVSKFTLRTSIGGINTALHNAKGMLNGVAKKAIEVQVSAPAPAPAKAHHRHRETFSFPMADTEDGEDGFDDGVVTLH